MSSMQSPAARVFNALSDVLRRPAMRPVTRTFSTLHAVAYRLTGGRAQNHKYPTMLLTVTGRKTGKPRTVPVIYIKEGDRFVIAAAYSGSDTDPVWWRNLQANPTATLDVNGETIRVDAALATDEERPDLWRRLVEMYPYFTEYQKRTTREIPVIVLTPR
ncbi:MAG: nitroreductase family deazaflavin-dependent oxidoreductase [Mycolicibacterium rufum]|uniref:Deazaflavin-dependent nitroreductase n=1 Tax=Mycolicibacterium chlorophenolicum TaxID=37916 RepID=A0A0J6WK54_9MYCO|nr:nitroreductase family deazaflavin-dependent oxidoreductase [Mycolicibacterium chlorophenolicum]KMO82082.1 Deazaflavin-dependent nitroreductase [Mycolicibacterium chlorophenolicum]MBI5340309.1 nitroreductase family deazaflavin-dependent oxidoreductase [Mycolicibacterium rufum]